MHQADVEVDIEAALIRSREVGCNETEAVLVRRISGGREERKAMRHGKRHHEGGLLGKWEEMKNNLKKIANR